MLSLAAETSIFAIAGVGIIVLAWLVELLKIERGSKVVNPAFIVTYILGVALLVIDGMSTGAENNVAWLNVISALVALLVLMKLRQGGKPQVSPNQQKMDWRR